MFSLEFTSKKTSLIGLLKRSIKDPIFCTLTLLNLFSSFDILLTKVNIKEGNVAATLLKIQERKTAKGNSYGVIKFTDLSSVFEIFVFSDILELNRNILIEGNSLIITLVKNISNDENRFKRINVQKIASLKDLFNKPVSEITFKIKSIKEIDEISNLIKEEGSTEININLKEDDNELIFKLKNKRLIDRKAINILRNNDISTIIH